MTFSLGSRLAAACVGLGLLTVLLSGHTVAAPRTAPFPGLRETTPSSHAIVGGKIIVSPKLSIDNGVVVIRDGVIVAVGPKDQIKIPGDAQIWSAEGKTLYPGFIDAFSELSGEAPRGGGSRGGGGESASGGAAYWNPNITPQVRANLAYASDAGANRKLRSQGITSRLVAPTSGIVKGTSVLVNTADESGKQSILKDQVALHLKLTVGLGGRGGGYPNSPMGAYTLVRQAFYDAGWYGQAWDAHQQGKDVPRPERSDALAVMRGYLGGKLPVIIDASDELYFLRADRIGDEFGLDVIVNGSGDEYRRLAEVKETGRAVIVPLNFPKAPNVATQEAAANVTLERLMHWDLAPENPARLAEAGVRISFTTAGLKDAGGFLAAVRKAVKRGLTPEAALTALTTTPAQLFGMSDRLGTIETGKAANVVVASGELFNDKTKVLETWVDGQRFEMEPEAPLDVRGVWTVKTTTADGKEETLKIELTGQPGKLAGKVSHGEPNAPLISPALSDMQFTTSFKGKPIGFDGVIQLSATVSQEAGDASAGSKPKLTWIGVIAWADGRKTPCSAEWAEAPKPADKPADKPAAKDKAEGDKDKDAKPKDGDKPQEKPADKDKPAEGDKPNEGDKPKEDKPDGDKPKDDKADKDKADAAKEKEKEHTKPQRALSKVNFPLGDFGRATPFPDQPTAVLFRNATVWTSGPEGRLDGADVLVENGKIKAVGRGLTAPDGAMLIDATGKHISPGIIDCHSHAATDGGINESGQTITAEVRVGDFVDPNDINIYRQVAGGVTSSNILHGSANTIGGQNQVLKFRWGAGPEEMKFAAAPQGIKFALGENVKQSNWGAQASSRYPQSRMGVEQLVRDEFKAAQAYREGWDKWNRTKVGLPPRIDLELQAVSEILEGKRLIHCHSYRQDEILALLRTCEDYKVKIATLQHILEGYKVADVMAKQGIGGSSFSDWWIYKYEVVDAIPYNGALMHNAGVVVSFNSDDAELARRLNLEAAKAVKYGGVSPEEALKFVTLNPAKQLRIDQYVGSLEPGKDADLVVWSTSPLSAYTRCEQTWIDGRRYFDRDEDRKQREEMTTLRAALIQRILGSGDATEGPDEGRKDQWPREDLFCHGHDHGGGDAHGHHHEDHRAEQDQ